MLQQWHVDCSPDHSLEGQEYALWLRDPLALYGSESAFLAPGYVDPEQPRRPQTLVLFHSPNGLDCSFGGHSLGASFLLVPLLRT